MNRANRNKHGNFTGRMQKKLVVLFLMVLLAFMGLSARLIYINNEDGEEYKRQILSQQSYSSTTIPYKRGDILDKNGVKLAVSEKVYNLVIDANNMLEKEESLDATMTALRRNSTCGFSEADCVSLADLTPENITDYLKSEEYAVEHLSEVSVTEKQAIRFTNGGQLDLARLRNAELSEGELVRVKYGEKFLGIGIADLSKGQLAIKCIINSMK